MGGRVVVGVAAGGRVWGVRGSDGASVGARGAGVGASVAGEEVGGKVEAEGASVGVRGAGVGASVAGEEVGVKVGVGGTEGAEVGASVAGEEVGEEVGTSVGTEGAEGAPSTRVMSSHMVVAIPFPSIRRERVRERMGLGEAKVEWKGMYRTVEERWPKGNSKVSVVPSAKVAAMVTPIHPMVV